LPLERWNVQFSADAMITVAANDQRGQRQSFEMR
jgi:hypothetical protein